MPKYEHLFVHCRPEDNRWVVEPSGFTEPAQDIRRYFEDYIADMAAWGWEVVSLVTCPRSGQANGSEAHLLLKRQNSLIGGGVSNEHDLVPSILGGPPLILQALKALDSVDRNTRWASILTLADVEHPAARDALYLATFHPIAVVRYQAAIELGKLGDSRACRTLMHLVAEGRSTRVAVGMNDWAPDDARRLLLALADSALVPDLLTLIMSTLNDSDSGENGTLVEALVKVGGLPAVLSLFEQLKTREGPAHSALRKNLISYFAETGETSVLANLACDRAAAGDDRLSAISALLDIRTEAAQQALIAFFREPDDSGVQAAVLQEMGGDLTVGDVLRDLEDWEIAVAENNDQSLP